MKIDKADLAAIKQVVGAAEENAFESDKDLIDFLKGLLGDTIDIDTDENEFNLDWDAPEEEVDYDTITIDGSRYRICNHLKEIKYELSDVAHILGGVYNKKQLFNWMKKNSEDLGEDWDYGVASDNDGYNNCWAIWCKDITGKSEKEIEEIIDDGHSVCFVKDDDGRLWYFGCDLD